MKYFLFVILVAPFVGLAQIPTVNTLRGNLSLSESLYSLALEGKSFPVSAHYYTSGVKAGETGGSIGVGWSLSIEGEIQRKVNGYPDDEFSTSSNQFGWLYDQQDDEALESVKESLQALSNFTTYGDDQLADHEITIDANKYKDVPDEFIVNFMGISGTIIFDRLGVPKFHYFNGCEIKVNYQTEDNTTNNAEQLGPILSFEIKDADGYTYLFSERNYTYQYSTTDKYYGYESFSENDFNILDAERYTHTWKISQIISPAGEIMTFNYNALDGSVENTPSKTKSSAFAEYQFTDEGDDMKYTEEARVYQGLRKNTLNQIEVKNIDGEVKERVVLVGWTQQNYDVGLSNEFNLSPNNFHILNRSKKEKLGNLRIYYVENEQDILAHDYKFIYYPISSGDMYFLRSIADVKGGQYLKSNEYDYHLIHSFPKTKTAVADSWGYFKGNAGPSGKNYEPKPNEVYVYMKLMPNSIGNKLNDYSYYFRNERPKLQSTNDIVFKLDGTNNLRNININYGSLKSVETSSGPIYEIDYELNNYFDEALNQNFYGGGIRVKSIVQYNTKEDAQLLMDSLSYTPVIKHYNYEAENGNSFGTLVSRPNYVLPQQYCIDGQTYEKKLFEDLLSDNATTDDFIEDVKRFIKRSSYDNDLNAQNYVLYDKVIERNNEFETIEYDYDNFGVFGFEPKTYLKSPDFKFYQIADDENPNYNALGLYELSESNGFPYAPLYNETLYNGQLKSVTVKNGEGNQISKTDYFYQLIDTSQVSNIHLYAVKEYPAYNNKIYSLGDYQISLGINKRVKQVVSSRIDAINETVSFQQETSFAYDNQLFLTQSETTVVADKTVTKYYKYPFDYDLSSYDNMQIGSAGMAIKEMQDKGIKTFPIESFTKFNTGNEERITNGSVTSYIKEGNYLLPNKYYSFSEILSRNFEESSIEQSGAISMDAAYTLKKINLDFEQQQFVTVQDVRSGNYSSIVYDHVRELPIVSIAKGRLNAIAFTNFDNTTSSDFQYTLPTEELKGNKILKLSANSNHNLVANIDNEGAVYELGFQYISTQDSELDITVLNQTGQVVIWSGVKTLKATDSWQPSFIKFNWQASGNIQLRFNPSHDINLDDVLLKPEKSLTQIMHYDKYSKLLYQANNNGIRTYYEYDKFGRQVLIRDGDFNIIKVNHDSEGPVEVFTAEFDLRLSSTGRTTDLELYELYEAVAKVKDDRISYYWTINNGEEVNGNSVKLIHFDGLVPEYTIQLRVVHPIYGEKIYSKSFNSDAPPVTLSANFEISKLGVKGDTELGNETYIGTAEVRSQNIKYYWKINDGVEELGQSLQPLNLSSYTGPYSIRLRVVHPELGEVVKTVILEDQL